MKNKKTKQKEKNRPEAESNLELGKTDIQVTEIGGRGGLDPSRFGDWEIAGKCVDF